ncbi:MAG: NADH-quinone oxidoreductase subunit C [Myxococcota bacterium]
MTEASLKRLEQVCEAEVIKTEVFRGDARAQVSPASWHKVANFLRDDDVLAFDHFIDLTAVDYPERSIDAARFDLVLIVRSTKSKQRILLWTELEEDEIAPTLSTVWAGADWAEREVFDMFGIRFEGHPDLRRILMYDEFEGHPLRKDYPIDRAQPLVPYRNAEDIHKLPPFGIEEGQPFGRVDWSNRLKGQDQQVSPSIALHSGQRRTLSDSDEFTSQTRPAEVTSEE